MKCELNMSVLLTVSLLGVNAAMAAEYTPAGLSGDLYADSTWTGGQKPGSTDPVKMSVWGGVYTLSQDMTIGSMRLSNGNVTFDFTEGNHTLTLTTPIDPYGNMPTLFRYTEYTSVADWTKLRGGVWECGNQEFDIVNLGFGGPYTFIMTNGCHLANVKRSFLFRRISNSRIYVTDESKITAGELNFGGGNLGTNDVIEVSGGSTVTLSGNFVGQSSSEAHCSNLLVVRGAGSSLTCAGGSVAQYLYLGASGYGGFGVRVADHATVTADYPTFCANAENCFVEVLDGATFEPGCYDWYGSRCHTLVSNATLNVRWGRFYLGGKSGDTVGHHNRLTLAGSATTFGNPMWGSDFIGPYSHDNVFEMVDGVSLSPGKSIKLATSTNNVIRMSGTGTQLALAGLSKSSSRYLFELGGTNAVNNTLEISDGATLKANGLWTYGADTKIVVSNGTLMVGGYTSVTDYNLWLGRSSGTGNALILKGTSPKVDLIVPNPDATVERLIMTGDSVLRYEIPQDGYAEGFVPVTLQGLYPANTAKAKLEISCSEWAAVKGMPRTELVLFRGREALTGDVKTWIAGQDLALPENVSCFVRGTDIVLRRRGNQGLMMLVR